MTIYTLKPKFIIKAQDYLRKIKLGWYKKKKVNKSKTPHYRFYHMKFKIHVNDDLNPQESSVAYEMVVPARAIFFAKALLERSVLEKVSVSVVDWSEITEEEHEKYIESKIEFALNNSTEASYNNLPSEKEFDEWIDENVVQLSDGNIKITKRVSITEWLKNRTSST